MAIRTTKMYKALSQKLAGANRFFPGELRKKRHRGRQMFGYKSNYVCI